MRRKTGKDINFVVSVNIFTIFFKELDGNFTPTLFAFLILRRIVIRSR